MRTQSDAIGAVVRGRGNLFFSTMVKRISREIENRGYTMVLYFIGSDDEVMAGAILEREKTAGILETMWLWNDYLLPYLMLDRKKYTTILSLIQYFCGSYGRVEMGSMMASIVLTIVPIIIVYILCQKHIIKGVAAGAVKG